MRKTLLELFQSALAAVEGRRLVRRELAELSLPSPLYLVAIGKAAASMAAGADEALGDRVAAGLVISKHGYLDRPLPYACLEAGHPRPDAQSLVAGERLLSFLHQAPASARFLFLISGGTSALVEALPEGIDLQDLREANHWLLGSGLAIDAMNRVRKGLSLIKGGRLARHLAGRQAWNLMISDVPGDDPATIGSGLLVADRAGEVPLEGLPDWLQALLGRVPPAPPVDDPCLAGIEHRILANNRSALEAVARRAGQMGLPVVRHARALDGPVEAAARRIGAALEARPGLHLFGGETTVSLPASPGRGGRNQHLALLLAERIAGGDALVLCAGTDGSDGETGDAGALVDGATRARGDLHYPGGLVAARDGFDSGRYLQASGDLLSTGPTGSNVMDVVLAYRPEPEA